MNTRTQSLFVFVALTVMVGAVAGESASFPAEWAEWEGMQAAALMIEGCPVRVAVPAKAAEGRPWALLSGGPPTNVDRALWEKGFHVVSMDTADEFGSPAAVKNWDAVYAEMTRTYGLAKRVAVEAYGVGGLLAHTWAAANPDKVACIWADAPVLDFRSWPGGTGKGERDETKWAALLEAYGFESEEQALAYERNPVDTVKPFAEAEFPVLHVTGSPGVVAPYKENAGLFRRRYGTMGGERFVGIVKQDDAPERALADPTAIVHFILLHTLEGYGTPREGQFKDLGEWKASDFSDPGAVHVDDGVVFLEEGNDMTGVTWAGPLVRMNYEITLEGMRVAGDDFFCGLTFPVEDDPCSLILGGWGGGVVGISCLDYMDAANNETTRFFEFQKGRWYEIRMRVTPGKLEAWIGDKQVVDVSTKDRKIGIRWEVEASVPLGIATWRTTGAIRNFRVREIRD